MKMPIHAFRRLMANPPMSMIVLLSIHFWRGIDSRVPMRSPEARMGGAYMAISGSISTIPKILPVWVMYEGAPVKAKNMVNSKPSR